MATRVAARAYPERDYPVSPTSRWDADRRLRFFQAVGAGIAATIVFLVLYYATLPLLPRAFAYPTTTFPAPAFAHRLDLAQFVGAFLVPPLPSPLTWVVGFVVLGGILVGQAVAYALLLSWAVTPSDAGKGAGFGLAAGLGLALTLTIANGVHPAVMRNALPDPGLFLLGWSGWALLQLLAVHVAYGGVLGALYGRGRGT